MAAISLLKERPFRFVCSLVLLYSCRPSLELSCGDFLLVLVSKKKEENFDVQVE